MKSYTRVGILKDLMEEKGYNQKTLAEEIGIHPDTLSKKLRGETQFNVNEINSICYVLKLSVDEAMRIFFTSYNEPYDRLKALFEQQGLRLHEIAESLEMDPIDLYFKMNRIGGFDFYPEEIIKLVEVYHLGTTEGFF